MSSQRASAFLSDPQAAAAVAGFPPADLEAALDHCLARAIAAWPDLPVEEERFVRHLARHTQAAATLDAALPTAHVEDLYFACACVVGLPRAQSLLDERYLSRVPSYLSRLRGAAAVVDETRQELLAKLLVGEDGSGRIAQYGGRGSLDSWICVTALRAALSRLRRQRPSDPLESADEVLPSTDPEIELLKQRYRTDFSSAFREAVQRLAIRDRQLLRLHYLDRLTMIQIAKLYGSHRTTIARWLDEAQSALLTATRTVLTERLGLNASECDSMLRLMRSRIDLSVRSLFFEPGERS